MNYMLQLRACQHIQGELAVIKSMTTHDIACVQASLQTLAYTASELANGYQVTKDDSVNLRLR
jgi:hypothetical protein